MSYDCWKFDQFAESEFWADSTFRSKLGFCRNSAVASPETLNTKVSIHELIFPVVTHTVYFDARFDSYGILNSGRGAENFLDRLGRLANDQALVAEDARILARVIYKFHRSLTQLSNAYSYTHFS
jgi:hypothetical protein